MTRGDICPCLFKCCKRDLGVVNVLRSRTSTTRRGSTHDQELVDLATRLINNVRDGLRPVPPRQDCSTSIGNLSSVAASAPHGQT